MARGKYRRRREARQRRMIGVDGTIAVVTGPGVGPTPSIIRHVLPFRAPDVKDGLRKWQIVDAVGTLVEHATSRDKARARARELNGSTS